MNTNTDMMSFDYHFDDLACLMNSHFKSNLGWNAGVKENFIHLDFKLETLDGISALILNTVASGTNSCKNMKGKLIDPDTVRKELVNLANKINNFAHVTLLMLEQKPEYEKMERNYNKNLTIREQCASLQARALSMFAAERA